MGNAPSVFRRKLEVVPEAGETVVFHFMEADGTPEVQANIADGLDPALIPVNQDIVVVEPAGKLPMLF